MSSRSQPASNHDKRINHLFVRLASIYGHLWSNLYKSEEFLNCTKKEWGEALRCFDDATLEKAVLQCRGKESWPPSLPMFVDICKSQEVKPDYFTRTENKVVRNEEVARTHLAKIKVILNMK